MGSQQSQDGKPRLPNRAAQQLGRMAKGKPKTLTDAERERRAKALAMARAKRWPVTEQQRKGRDAT